MFSPRWRKVGRDLWGNKSRTLLVVLSIAVGVFAVGLIAGTQAVLFRDMNASFLASNPAHAVLFADPNNADDPDKPAELFDDELVQAVRRMDEVQEAEGRTEIEVRLQLNPTQGDETVEEARELDLQAIDNYEDIRIWKIWPQSGAWPPAKHEFLLERASLDFANANVGDRVTIKTPDGKLRQMRLAGIVYDPEQASPTVEGGQLSGYISLDTLEWLGEPRGFQQLNITVTGYNRAEEYVKQVTDGAVQQIVIVEGVLIGCLSWLVGVLIALPVSVLLSNVVGELILRDALTYTFSVGGALLWLVVVVLLAALASFLPARGASRLTVREVLAYE